MSRKIRYIGKCPGKKDNVAKTGLRWRHPGAVIEVQEEAAVRLLQSPRVWVEVGGENDPGPDAIYRVEMGGGDHYFVDSNGAKVTESGEQDRAVDQSTIDPEPARPLGMANDPEDAIRDAIRQLNPKNPAHFTTNGTPRIEAIADLLGYQISAQERTRIWSDMQVDEPVTLEDMNGETIQPALVL
jgi:hypothetical protein